MKRLIPLLLVLSAACATTAHDTAAALPELPTQHIGRKEVIRRVLGSSVRIFINDGKEKVRSGSGVVIGSESATTGSELFIITNAHLLDAKGLKAPVLRVVAEINGESFEYPAEPLEVGETADQDLALLRVRGVQLPAVDLANNDELKVGDDVVVVGSPFGQEPSVSGGMISHLQHDATSKSHEPNLLKTDAAVGYGSSGGGIFSATSGKLLGLVEGYRTTRIAFAVEDQNYAFELPMPGETFAAPATKIRKFLSERGFARLLKTHSDAVHAEAR